MTSAWDGRGGNVGKPLDALLDLLDLEQIEWDIFRGRSPDERRQRVFGGQVAGQALVAAGRTVPPDRPVHSLHAYFIRGGDPAVPLVYTVDRTRDGRSFTTRRVSAIQHGRTIFTLSASFHHAEPGPAHSNPMPEVPPPDRLERNSDRLAQILGEDHPRLFGSPFDLRSVGPLSVEAYRDPSLRTTTNLVWLRVEGDLPDDPLLHVCLMTYASDMTLLDSVLLGHGLSWVDGRTTGASLDHAMWFHRTFRADRWLLYAQESPVAYGARGLARGQVFTAEGQLVVSVMQEGLIRTEPRIIENRSLKNCCPLLGAALRLPTCPWASCRRSWREVPIVTNINSGALAAVSLAAGPWRARLGAFSPRSAFLGTGVPGAGCGTGPSVVVRPVPRVRDKVAMAIPAPLAASMAQPGQTNNYNHMTSVLAFGEGTSGPPPYREPA
jgi:acyl-CoA thioesterase II